MASEAFDAVLAEAERGTVWLTWESIRVWRDRLAAAHAAEVAERDARALEMERQRDDYLNREWIATKAKQKAEARAEAAERDARRYRWLRGKLSISALRSGVSGLVNGRDYRTDFDAFVDAAIATTEQAAGGLVRDGGGSDGRPRFPCP